jgi:hypothetical protein
MNTRKLPHVVNHLYTNNKVDKIKINLQTKGTGKKKKRLQHSDDKEINL